MGAALLDLMAIFERSPELTSRLLPLLAPADTSEVIVAKARAIVGTFGEGERIAILGAHPRIGDTVRVSELSRREQGSDGDEKTLAELGRLNDEYERRFGFRFVVFVNGRSKAELVPLLRERMRRSQADELATGIDEFLAISLDRLRRAERVS
ncbi:MAG: 2-oxo-4-hydroxy-4-carboxy-5-ureidoimidazoline decarboxylase [Chloroflexota bacterium]|nr:2-oxo-4-hydroxy-4-carboxy-5-ureidoimidazoline decarboxylase [Chloroflexota bacterium]